MVDTFSVVIRKEAAAKMRRKQQHQITDETAGFFNKLMMCGL